MLYLSNRKATKTVGMEVWIMSPPYRLRQLSSWSPAGCLGRFCHVGESASLGRGWEFCSLSPLPVCSLLSAPVPTMCCHTSRHNGLLSLWTASQIDSSFHRWLLVMVFYHRTEEALAQTWAPESGPLLWCTRPCCVGGGDGYGSFGLENHWVLWA